MADSELIAKIARGEQACLGQLYDRHAGLLLGILTRILGDAQEAEDVLHEVFLEVWERAGDYDPERGSVRAWLVMRARSRGLDRLRALGRARALPTEALPVEVPVPPAPADVISVRRALARLAPELRVLLELGYFGGMSSAEIAAHQQLAIGTVKSRVARALAELRESLQSPS
jgi:RNA polymerase sigma-70 factor, ECF subfamily